MLLKSLTADRSLPPMRATTATPSCCTGHVVLDHGLGKMTAEEASLQRQEAGKDFPFSLIQLRKDVLLALKTARRFLAAAPIWTLPRSKASSILQKTAKSSTPIRSKRKEGRSKPFQTQGQFVELNFSKQSHDGKKTEYEIENILAKEDVVIDYADDFQLYADQALYRKELSHD